MTASFNSQGGDVSVAIDRDRIRPAPDSGLQLAGPWRRYLARYVDIIILSNAIIFGVVQPLFGRTDALLEKMLIAMAVLPVALVINAAIVTIFGNSLGKTILGIVIRPDPSSGPVDFMWSLRREFQVWLYGLGLGVPPATLVMAILNYQMVKGGGSTNYDLEVATIERRPLGPMLSVCGIIVACAVYVEAVGLIVVDVRRQSAQSFVAAVATISVNMQRDANRPYADPGAATYGFSYPDDPTAYIVGAEPEPGLSLDQYAALLQANLASLVSIDAQWKQVSIYERDMLANSGMSTASGYPVSLLAWHADGRFFRLIAIDKSRTAAPSLAPTPTLLDLIGKTPK